MRAVVYLNGEYLPRDQARLSVDDRGFIFGDGLYEVTRVVDGRLFEVGRHLRRLAHGLSELGMASPMGDAELLEVHRRLIEENELLAGHATVYVQVTRGAAPRAHQFPPPSVPPTVFLSASPLSPNEALRERGAHAITTPDIRWSRCDLKTINLLPSVLAKQQAVTAGALDAVFVRDGAVTEGSHTNVFGVIDGELRTYPRSNYILGGVTRDVVLELAAEKGIPARETPIFQHDLRRLEELFLTGTTTDVMPVVRLDDRPVGSGRPGPVARALQAALLARFAAGAALEMAR